MDSNICRVCEEIAAREERKREDIQKIVDANEKIVKEV